MPTDLEADVEEFHNKVTEMTSTAESRQNECLDYDTCDKIHKTLEGYRNKIDEKAFLLYIHSDSEPKREYYEKVHKALDHWPYDEFAQIFDLCRKARQSSNLAWGQTIVWQDEAGTPVATNCDVRWRDLLPYLRSIQGRIEAIMESIPWWRRILRMLRL